VVAAHRHARPSCGWRRVRSRASISTNAWACASAVTSARSATSSSSPWIPPAPTTIRFSARTPRACRNSKTSCGKSVARVIHWAPR
jgi:hypothetical protein